MPWLTLIALALVERWMARGRAPGRGPGRGYYPRTNNLARFLVLERLGYYSPWLIGLRFLSGLFRRRGDGGPIV